MALFILRVFGGVSDGQKTNLCRMGTRDRGIGYYHEKEF